MIPQVCKTWGPLWGCQSKQRKSACFLDRCFSFYVLFPCILLILHPPSLSVSCLSVCLHIFLQFRLFPALTFVKGLWMFCCDSFNLNLVRQVRDSKQKLSCVSQLPSYQSEDFISFLKAPIVFHEACEIVTCWVTVSRRAAGQAGMVLPEPLTAVHWGGRCKGLAAPYPLRTEHRKLLLSA